MTDGKELDPALPGFTRVWDLGWARDMLAAALSFEKGWTLERVELERIRHSVGVRGIVQYRVHLSNEAQRAVIWVAGVTYADGRSRRVVSRLARRDLPVWAPTVSPVAYEPSLDMALQVFPTDRKLPGLAFLGNGLPPELELALGCPSETALLTPVRHRLGLGATIRVESETVNSFVKFHRLGGAKRVFDHGCRIVQSVVGTVRLVVADTFVESLDATLTDGVCAPAINQLKSEDQMAALPEVAAHLARLHSHRGTDLVDQRELPLRRARRAVPWLSRMVPEAASLFESQIRHGEEASGGTDTFLVHGDLKPDHVLIGDGTSTLIDLDSSGWGRPSSDLAALAVRLEDEAAAVALVSEYQRRAGPLVGRMWSSDWALASIKYAMFHAQHQTEGWRDSVVRIAEAEPPPIR